MNQLLTLLDGTTEMNNILVVALTNRKDMLDPALLRPGRLEVHLEIGLPTADGREDILNILFAPLVQASYLSLDNRDKWIPLITKRTVGANGADLSGVMRNAASHAISRWQDDLAQKTVALSGTEKTSNDINRNVKRGIGTGGLLYVWDDFDRALQTIND